MAVNIIEANLFGYLIKCYHLLNCVHCVNTVK